MTTQTISTRRRKITRGSGDLKDKDTPIFNRLYDNSPIKIKGAVRDALTKNKG